VRKKTPAEMERAKIAKATRSIVRLKHSLAADVRSTPSSPTVSRTSTPDWRAERSRPSRSAPTTSSGSDGARHVESGPDLGLRL
jgi:hypothetical protein